MWVLAGVLVLGALGGCSPPETPVKEADERAYRRGKSLLREGRREEALQAFLALLGARPDAPESHLEAGLLYLNHIKDPLAAIYHFRGYLALRPDGEHADFVRELILTAQKDFAQTLPGEPFSETVERVNLLETVRGLRDENDRLKQASLRLQRELADQETELRRLRQAAAQPVASATRPQEVAPIIIQQPPGASAAPAPAQARTYTVEGGDTLSRISVRVYGDPNKWKQIFEANRDQLASPNALRPGQVLRIP